MHVECGYPQLNQSGHLTFRHVLRAGPYFRLWSLALFHDKRGAHPKHRMPIEVAMHEPHT
jgi:hypothetical protein